MARNVFFLSQVFKLEGSDDRYLFVKPGKVAWSICPDLKGENWYIRSGNAGPRCPASPESKFNKRWNQNDWSFNKAGEDGKDDWKEGGIIVKCSVHDQSST